MQRSSPDVFKGLEREICEGNRVKSNMKMSCPSCGAEWILPESVKGPDVCPFCGAELNPNAKFCPECGSKQQ